LFALVAYNALSMVVVQLFIDFLGIFGITNLVAIRIATLPTKKTFWKDLWVKRSDRFRRYLAKNGHDNLNYTNN